MGARANTPYARALFRSLSIQTNGPPQDVNNTRAMIKTAFFAIEVSEIKLKITQGVTKLQPPGIFGPLAPPTRTLLFMYQIDVW